ncbi:MAG: hypothetical protein ABIA62_01220 [Candidatus Woesearchaeota archaeon]
MAVKNIQSINFTKIEIRIVKHLFKYYKDKYNARQLAKILDINHAHANKLCNLLVGKGILLKEEMGNAVYFSFNHGNEYALKFMVYLFSLEEKEFPRWLTVLLHKLKEFSPHIKLGLVFGSSIKNKEFRDVDVLLMYDPGKSITIRKIKEGIRKSQLIEQPIRYVDISEKDILSNKDDKVFYAILSDNLIFCSPEKYVEVIRKCRR